MVDLVLSAARLVAAFFLVFLNGFFVAAEFAFVRIRRTSVDAMVEAGKPAAGLVKEATDNLDGYLAVSQLGITLSSLGLGWIGEPTVAALIEPVLGSVLPAGSIHVVAVALGFAFVTFLHVVFGELAPKTLAIQEAEQIALLVAAPMKFFYYLFIPGIVVFNGTANFFTRLVGVSPASEGEEPHSEEEILTIVTRSGEHGGVDADEVEMIEAIFELDDRIAREVMVPRPDVASVTATMPVDEIRRVVVKERYTRYVVLDEDDESVVGFVHVKDLLRADDGDGRGGTLTARDLARDVLVVPENRRLGDLLGEFQAHQRPLAVVIDEWGAFEGIVTVEDVIEEIVGDIRDDFDQELREPSIDELDGGAYAVDGGVTISEVNNTLDAEFESDEFDTIGGLVLGRLGHAPDVGDRVELDGFSLDVEAVDGNRISTVVVRREKRRGEASNRS